MTQQEDKLISMTKLMRFMKAARIDVACEDVRDPKYLYGTGRNGLADLVIVGAVMGEFDPDEEREEAEGLK